MKKLEDFEQLSEAEISDFLQPFDEIDFYFYEYIICGWVPSNYEDGKFGQNGECNREKNGIMFYESVIALNDKYYYLGEMPSFNPDVYRNHR